MAASKGVGKESGVCDSSASNIPSQLRHRREVFSTSFVSNLSLLSDNLSGKLYSDFSGEAFLDVLLLLDNCSQLCEDAGEALSRDDWRLLRGLTGGSVCMSGSSQSVLSLPRLSQEAIRW